MHRQQHRRSGLLAAEGRRAGSLGADLCVEHLQQRHVPTVTYNSTGSGGGLKEWNHDGKLGHINTAIQFVGTDDAPTAAQIENMTKVTAGASLVVVPVAQTSISVIANPPAECSVSKIKNVDLEKVWRGVYLTWSQVSTASGAGCSAPIVRVPRKDGSAPRSSSRTTCRR